MNDVSIAFTELFYGSGAWLGLLLLLSIIVMLSLAQKYVGLLMVPVCVFVGIKYLDYSDLVWNGVIMFLASIFIIIGVAKRGNN